jgi:3-methyladenine DNA glycosylase AlkD
MAAVEGVSSAAVAAATIEAEIAALGTPERAISEQAYLKSELRHFGTRVPAVRKVVKAWLRANSTLTHDELFAVADALWVRPVHESRSAAIELLNARPTLVDVADIGWIERHLRECRTWALVDPLAGWVTAELAARDAAVLPHLDRWVTDDDFWVRRSAVLALRTLLQQDRELARFFRYADQLLPEREFFIRKVIGWVAREVAARHPEEVGAWLRANMARMNMVTLREPVKYLPDGPELLALYRSRERRGAHCGYLHG